MTCGKVDHFCGGFSAIRNQPLSPDKRSYRAGAAIPTNQRSEPPGETIGHRSFADSDLAAEDKLGMVVAPNVSTKEMAATGAATPIQPCAVAHIFTDDA